MDSVAAVVGSRVASFELGILCQIFGLDRSDDGLPTYDFAVCGQRPGLVPTTSGFSIEVTHGLDRIAEADLVAVPAWPDLDAPLDEGVATALREASERGAALLAICTGAFALAGAGLLDGRRATTHWQFTERLARQFPRVQIERDVLYVSDGPILTSAGAAAGIDACLHMLRSVYGSATANALARRMVVPATAMAVRRSTWSCHCRRLRWAIRVWPPCWIGQPSTWTVRSRCRRSPSRPRCHRAASPDTSSPPRVRHRTAGCSNNGFSGRSFYSRRPA